MTTETNPLSVQQETLTPRGYKPDRSWRKLAFKGLITLFFIVYSVITLSPFYILFVRTFVGTKDATDLWLWLPPAEEISLEADLGNMSVFYNLDLNKVKRDLGIAETEYINPKWKLKRIAEEYNIPEYKIRNYFQPFVRYNGWIVLLTNDRFLPSLIRTVIVTVGSVIGINALSVLTASAIAGLRRRYQMFVYNVYLLQAVIPIMLILVPQFIIVQWFLTRLPGYADPGLMREASQIWVIILLHIQGTALSTMIFTAYISTIPAELEDAAYIDGASRWQYTRYILFPLMKVPIAGVTVVMLPYFWNDFIAPYVYLDPSNTTLLPLIQSFAGQYTTNFQVIFAGIFISTIPLVIVYILFRRLFVEGVMAGAVKG